ncbi:MAG: hypothetical protein JJE04_24910 [Acidobacteriia bacterium]|nr:hypothetical protein [Terriglobia bacterium]
MFFKKSGLSLIVLALLADSLLADNVFVFPTFTGSSTGTAQVFRGTPLTQVATFSASTEALVLLRKPAAIAADVKYYVIGRSGSNTLQVLNSTFTPVGPALSLGQTVTAAGISPDGKRLLIMAGNLQIFDTATDTQIQTGFLDVGIAPTELAFSQDSRRAFLVSPAAQRVTAVNLTDNTVAGQIPLPGVTAGSIATGPNAFIYVSTQGRVLEIDPRPATIDSNAVRRQFTLQGANVGRLHFTPDGTRALAVNQSPQSGALLFFFSLDLVSSGFTQLSSSGEGLSGFAFDKIDITGNDRAYVTTSAQSVNPRKLFRLTLPPAPLAGELLGTPAIAEAFFGSLGNIPIVDTVTHSSEVPIARRLFVSAPLNLLQPSASNTIYTADMTPATPNIIGTNSLTYLPGLFAFTGPVSTLADDPANGLIRFNLNQAALAPNAKSLPIGVQLIGLSGKPIFNAPILFTPTTAGASIDGATLVNTNADGLAFVTVQGPASPGEVQVNVSILGSGLTTAFTLTVGAPGGGGGGGGGGTPGAGGITNISGDGQVLTEGGISFGNSPPTPLVVEVRDATGKIVAGATVTWAVTQGGGTFTEGLQGDTQDRRTTITDSNGRTQNYLRAPALSFEENFKATVMTASTAGDFSVTMFSTTYKAISGGNQTPPPTVVFLAPTNDPFSIRGKAGQTLVGAIKIQVQASAGAAGTVMQYVGMEPRTENKPEDGPVVSCVPKAVPLTNETGVGICDLKLSGKAGSGVIRLNIGGFSERPIYLTVDPGEPGLLTILSGNNQSARTNENLPGSLIVELGDGGGNKLPGATIRWEVVTGTAILNNSTTVTDSNGRSTNNVRLGPTAGPLVIRAAAVGGTQPNITFNATATATLSGFTKISGDGQTTFINTGFAAPLVVEVKDTSGAGVPGQTVTFTAVDNRATLSAASALTGANGQASVSVRAGTLAGAIQINVAVAGLPGATFNLTAQLPGPGINALDFFNTASGERGAVVGGSIYTMVGTGIAPDLKGCSIANVIMGPLPTRLAGVEILFGSSPAPIYNVCNIDGRESVTMQAPFDLVGGGTVAVTVRVGTGSSVVNNVQVLLLQPGIFETTDAQGRRYVAALRPNGSYVTPENPARYGEIIRAYITGGGQVTPNAITGVTGVPGQNMIAPVLVGINDSGVRLVSSTYAVGSVGLYEIAFEITPGIASGPARPLGIILTLPNGQFVFPGNSPTIAIAP